MTTEMLGTPLAVRLAARAQRITGQTAGLAPGFVQGNLVVLPASVADEFLRFCQRNPKPCPLIAVSEPGEPRIASLGEDVDLRTDLPCYRVWRDGAVVASRDRSGKGSIRDHACAGLHAGNGHSECDAGGLLGRWRPF